MQTGVNLYDRQGVSEDPAYLSRQLITCIGNKRALLELIGQGVARAKSLVGRDRLRVMDLFSGSGVVARFLKQHACHLVVNDLEAYADQLNRCYLANVDSLDLEDLRACHAALLERLTHEPLVPGLLAREYAPQDDRAIREGERVFYTSRNARFLDTARLRIRELPAERQAFFLAPLLSEASIHANTSGVFKGFYKDRESGRGKFGGSRGQALGRILGDITLPFPVFSRFCCAVERHQTDANRLVDSLAEADLAYLDPPYNQHPYGSNYFMLNLLVSGTAPARVSPVSGIPVDWNRSVYNRPHEALDALEDLVRRVPARVVLLSFNSEGFVPRPRMETLLRGLGSVEVLEQSYAAFRGSRNLRGRPLRVTEFLYVLRK